MDNGYTISLIGLGILTGIALGASTRHIPNSALHTYYSAIKQCEAELPRSQRCVITAIPEMDDEE